jgi:hypothetical protein
MLMTQLKLYGMRAAYDEVIAITRRRRLRIGCWRMRRSRTTPRTGCGSVRARADPVVLLGEIRVAQGGLGERVDRRGMEPGPPQPMVVDLDRFAASLGTAWRDGERRPTHRRPYRRRKPVARRPSMLDAVRDQIRTRLDGEPTISALEVLRRLKLTDPDRFSDRYLRTVQRAVKARRG